MNYFDLPEVSNSDLSSLKYAFHGIPDNRDELEDIFNFGSLVDAILSEPFRVSTLARTLTEDDGKVIEYSFTVFSHACRLAEAMRKDPVIGSIVTMAKGQHIVRRQMELEYLGEVFTINGKCKFDAYIDRIRMGADYKTTSCKTMKQFKAAVAHFDWDRQAAWYMDLAQIDRHWIAGVSKHNDEIFKIPIQRGDATYQSGKDKYTLWAYRWVNLIDGFNDHLKIAA